MKAKDKIRKALAKNPNLSVAELADKLNISRVTVYAVRKQLAQETFEETVEETAPVEVESVTAKQVGGNHYTTLEIQPWEVIERNNMGFFDGNAVKYLMRYKAKGGVEDLKKAHHYLEKLIELENGRNA